MSDLMRERVRAGAELLDAAKPGWYQHLDMGQLHMGDCADCVLGQVYGFYEDGLVALWPDEQGRTRDNLARLHGFELLNVEMETQKSYGGMYLRLAGEWARQVHLRFAADRVGIDRLIGAD